MTVSDRSAPPRADAPAASAVPGGARPRDAPAGAALVDGSAALIAAFETRCRASPTLRSALLLGPSVEGAPPRPLATWPAASTPPESLARASASAWQVEAAVLRPVDAMRDDGARLLAGRIGHRGRVVGALAALFDGEPQAIARDLGRWRGLLDLPASAAAAAPRDRPAPAPAPQHATPARHAPHAPHARPALPARPARPATHAPPAINAPRPLAPSPEGAAPPAAAARILACQAALLDAADPASGLRALLAVLADQYRSDRVAYGRATTAGARLVAMSHSAADRWSRDAAAPIETAMDEALDQQACVTWPGLPGVDARRVAAQAQLARLSQAGAVCCVPLVAAGEPVGALSLERAEPFDETTRVELDRIAAFVAPVIALRRQAERPMATLGTQLRTRLFGRGRRLGLVLVAIGVAVAAAAWVPVPDRVSAPARVEGAVQRALTAPSDGWLMRVHVRPGDAVRAEQVLVELDDRDLSLERLRHATEAEQADRQATEAIAREDRAQFAVQSARAAQARAQLALADARLDRQRVRAPFDGIVLAGDLTQSLGAPVRAGDTLLSVAPAGRHRIVVEVDERDVARVAPGGTGELALTAHAGRRMAIEVVRIAPAAVVRDGRNVFEVEARPAADADLRPGYLGVAKLHADARPVLRSAFERPWRAVSQRLWAWGW